ncbi:hypothetical protein K474DRAFT_1770786 [Panus rudis PR-1116 ss-1]|nr:hypothetical protein K474DRAFT_1770786 [Panus rudis PR-1116 ss-1]
MSPCKPAKNLKVHVPRHNSQRLGPAVTAQVQTQAKQKRIRVDVRQTAYEPTSILAQAIESASDWNSLLTTARAERGPQWDIGTQQFLVEEHSDLYYDPSPLLGYLKESQSESDDNKGGSRGSSSKPPVPTPDFSATAPGTPQLRRNPSMPPPPGPHGPPYSPRHSSQFSPYSNMGPGPVPASQFYGGGGDPGMASPLRMGSIGGLNMDNMGGMGSMGMASPELRRRAMSFV